MPTKSTKSKKETASTPVDEKVVAEKPESVKFAANDTLGAITFALGAVLFAGGLSIGGGFGIALVIIGVLFFLIFGYALLPSDIQRVIISLLPGKK